MPASSPRLYFAYGSNLSPTQMSLRCPSSVPVGLAHLAGHTFIINSRGYANVVRTAPEDDAPAPPTDPAGPGVYGVLYTLPPADEATLDVCEGVPYAYQKHDLYVTVVSTAISTAAAPPASPPAGDAGPQQGASITALVYVDGERTTRSLPRAEYVGRMNRGLDEAGELFGLPAAYVDRVVRPYIPAQDSPIVGAIADPFHERA
ncbi:AIG2-like family protein [Colletotrichum graminicola]|uniref:gamma-glutamylcyclotransferase n=1 Tax=Colletotrichum graminicola (strain M1.001 / M2 / FGSC 10212) TaxID=645133 RepID=E3Q341_COLGM|nr:AIG2-like family protein [Colletotrichum graminicola M1.001]EFQ25020.1 AIG2-like family protein [Colletotrichum graminicola M1.001]WDK15398.1 AIG2-like family protein [Colletotrichum graminicola]